MVALSKLFKDGLEKGLCCNDIVHDGSCTNNLLHSTYKYLISNMKYFAPVIGLPLLVHIRSLNKELLLSTLKYYIEAVMCGGLTAMSITFFICFFRNLFGKFGYYTFLFWPTALGSMSLWAIPRSRAHHLFETSVFQCTMESIIMQQKTLLTKSIMGSKLFRTLIFMCCSGLIMNAKRVKKYKGFWLLEPTPYIARNLQVDYPIMESEISHEISNNESIDISCNHMNKSCTRYTMEGMRNYMIIGVTLDFIKMLMTKVSYERNDLAAKCIAKLKAFRINSCALLTCSIAIYRFLHCYFNRNYGGDTTLNHTVAAFLSGSAFIFYPKLTLLCFALVAATQISWQHFKLHITTERYNDKFNWINRLPCTKIFYPLALGYLVNTYGMRSHYISRLGEVIINGLTNNYAKGIKKQIVQLEKHLESSLRVINA